MASTVLVCTDGSELAQAAAGAGLALLVPADRVVIVTVVGEPAMTLPYDASGMGGAVLTPEEVAQIQQDMRAVGQDAVDRIAATITVDEYETKILTGSPGHAICALAAEVGATTVILGSRGHGGIKRALLGSVSDHVVRHSPCPVLVVPAH